MRLRICIMLAALIGALGSLIMAVDVYRRVVSAERIAAEASGGSGGVLVFGMAHALGSAGMAIVFLAICLLIVAERKIETAAEKTAAEMPSGAMAAAGALSTDESFTPFRENSPSPESFPPFAAPAAEAAFPTPRPPPPPPKNTFRPAKNIYFVEAPPSPEAPAPPAIQKEPIGLPIPLTESEFTRAVVYENVLREQGEVPTGTPLESESKTAEAVLGETDGTTPKQ